MTAKRKTNKTESYRDEYRFVFIFFLHGEKSLLIVFFIQEWQNQNSKVNNEVCEKREHIYEVIIAFAIKTGSMKLSKVSVNTFQSEYEQLKI